jgi:hypothetical protein
MVAQKFASDGDARDERRSQVARMARRRSGARSADRRGWFQSHTREKALMLNFVEMNLSKAASE